MEGAGREARVLTRLALPVVATQLGQMTLGVVDTWMVGRLGALELGAVALADVICFGTLILGIGLVMGIDPIVSQAHGAGEGARAGRALQHGVVLALLATLPLTVVWLLTGTLLEAFGQTPALAATAQVYARAQTFSIAPFLVFTALRQYLHGRGDMTTPLLVIAVANLANVFFNWTLIFGNLGLPALGVQGAGLATGLTRTLMLLSLAVLMFRGGRHADARAPWSRAALHPAGLRHVLAYGVPVAVQFGLEGWAFSASTLFAGWLSEAAVAAHVIVLRLASLTFMVPLGISIAAATRVGNLLGARDRPGAQRAAWVALAMGCGVMAVSAVLFVLLRHDLAGLFSDDAGVIAIAAVTFPVAAAFQVFDGTQVVGGGILRGMGTTRPAALFNLVGYYGLALPLAWVLGFRRGLGLPGVWWGLAAGLAIVAGALVAWVAWRGPAKTRRLAI